MHSCLPATCGDSIVNTFFGSEGVLLMDKDMVSPAVVTMGSEGVLDSGSHCSFPEHSCCCYLV